MRLLIGRSAVKAYVQAHREGLCTDPPWRPIDRPARYHDRLGGDWSRMDDDCLTSYLLSKTKLANSFRFEVIELTSVNDQ